MQKLDSTGLFDIKLMQLRIGCEFHGRMNVQSREGSVYNRNGPSFGLQIKFARGIYKGSGVGKGGEEDALGNFWTRSKDRIDPSRGISVSTSKWSYFVGDSAFISSVSS
jgi:hypothetical protein